MNELKTINFTVVFDDGMSIEKQENVTQLHWKDYKNIVERKYEEKCLGSENSIIKTLSQPLVFQKSSEQYSIAKFVIKSGGLFDFTNLKISSLKVTIQANKVILKLPKVQQLKIVSPENKECKINKEDVLQCSSLYLKGNFMDLLHFKFNEKITSFQMKSSMMCTYDFSYAKNLQYVNIESDFEAIDLTFCVYLKDVTVTNLKRKGTINLPYVYGRVTIHGNGDGLSVNGSGYNVKLSGVIQSFKPMKRQMNVLVIKCTNKIDVTPDDTFRDEKRNRNVVVLNTKDLVLNAQTNLEYVGIPYDCNAVNITGCNIKAIYTINMEGVFFLKLEQDKMVFANEYLRSKRRRYPQYYQTDAEARVHLTKEILNYYFNWRKDMKLTVEVHWYCVSLRQTDILTEEHWSKTDKTWELIQEKGCIEKEYKKPHMKKVMNKIDTSDIVTKIEQMIDEDVDQCGVEYSNDEKDEDGDIQAYMYKEED
ncbi:hypothetical protein EIN_437100 [Entamoeba invadens IP1]|uniref:Uncharacterized protein n=1 Tax=Entamoeba invadens IP1 TaxID=370355 RepID=A0A0A1U3Q0_ENTIV|nr:hypothetical protein EIN_437100 [Entamoeba invadens IP1]ELP88780.1 hypothetical protein EIN_437100 [Entamoeba invadens IP1]|eukprot:XP_004255551.1 hypothetical protein EIN_437100 [Entamoeba invadens IP1]